MKRFIALAAVTGLVAACDRDPSLIGPLTGPELGSSSASPASTTYSGRATVVNATVLGINTVLSDAGPLPPTGGAAEASLLTANVPGLLTANVLHATTVGQGDAARSEATVADLSLTVAGNSIAAEFLAARASARCVNGRAVLSGSSEILQLAVNGQAIAVTGAPNQTVSLPVGQVIINEQTTGGDTAITVNALHVIVPGVADVVVSSAHADIGCGRACPPGADFVTGGGWITGTLSGAKGTFGVSGGIKNGAFWGHLTYIDHGTGMRVKGTGVTAYEVVDATTRRIRGTAEVGAQGGFIYEVILADNGEPGRQDRFTLRLSNGYEASGTLGGGNIQLHLTTPCP